MAAVTGLRQALADSPENPRFVETVARRGYRFIGPVSASPLTTIRLRLPGMKETAILTCLSRRLGVTTRFTMLSSGKDRRVALIRKNVAIGLSLSPGGRHILYSQIDQAGRDLVLVDHFK